MTGRHPGSGFQGAPRTQVQTEAAAAFEPGLTERRCRLVVLLGAAAGTAVEIDKPRYFVGKDEHADLVLKDPTVSREHFVIEQHGGACVIRDQQSTNGTWIDQFRMCEAYPG